MICLKCLLTEGFASTAKRREETEKEKEANIEQGIEAQDEDKGNGGKDKQNVIFTPFYAYSVALS